MESYYAALCHVDNMTKFSLRKGIKVLFAFLFIGGFTTQTLAQNPEPDTELYEQLKVSGQLDLGYETMDMEGECPDVHILIEEAAERDDCYIPHDPATWTNFPGNDDGSTSLISVPFTFDLYGTSYSSLYINNNGNITFDNPISSYTPDGFPITTPMIAPFWGDVDTRGASGEVWYIVTDHALYVNWVEVGPYHYNNYDDTVISTFQLIITDGTDPVLDPGNNVAFYYQDMGWTTGDASDGVNGFGGSPATVGINSGNGTDFVQIGRFGLDNSDYDGPEGETDGVHWLDDQCFEFNVSDAENFPPVAQNFPSNNSIGMCSDESITLEFGFIGPEGDQMVSIAVDDNGAPGLIVNSNTSGNPGLVNVTITPGMSGDFTYTFTATDDYSPAGVTVINLLVNVDNCGTEGCTDSLACNFDSGASTDDGSCSYSCYGCTDDLACNFNSGSSIDDGSCTYPGCTDSAAVNFNSSAGCDDGSCVYDSDDCILICPANIQIECGDSTDPANTGEASTFGMCDNSVISFNDESEGDDCLAVIIRTWTLYIPGTPEVTCVQIIIVADTEGPIFTETPADLTVDCIEDVPAPVECIADDACNSVLDTDIFTSETGNPSDSCILSTAVGPGDDWAIWIPTLEAEGLAPSANWLFDGDGYFIMYNDNTARLYGNIYNDVNPDLTFEVDLWFENGMDWDAWSALGRNYKDDLNLVTDEFEDWTYYEMANIFSHLTGTGLLAGSELYLSHAPANFYFGFQCGEKANNKNGNNGMSGWFSYTGTYNGQTVEGSGDVNVDKECVPYTLSECINDDEFTYMWHAIDDCGNVSFATQVITVDDNIAPEFTNVPADETVECDLWPIPVPTDIEAIDNCDPGVLEIIYIGEFTGEGDECEYTMLRRWDAIDFCGNIATYFQTITIVDTTDPVFTFVPEDATYECDETVPFIDAQAEDACQDMVTITFEDVVEEGNCPQAYTIYRTFYANDGCENVAEALQVITVVDTTAPVFNPYDVQVFIDCEDIDSVEELTATDNCDEEVDVTYTEILMSGGCLGVLVRTYTAVDDCGNETIVEQYITLQDFEGPTIENPADMTIECDEVGDLMDPESITITDNCSEFDVEFSETIIDGPCDDTYTIVWHWIATDYCDNVSEATTSINVQDTTAPELIGVPADMELNCNDPIPDAIVSATDNCDDDLVVSVTADTEVLDCGSIFTRTWCVSDDCGNETCATQIINIFDDEAPVFTYVPADITVECDEAIPYEDATAEDNCSDFEITFEDTQTAGDCPQEYTIVRCYTATDACGNSATACQTISVLDTTAPIITAEIDIDRPCDDYSDIYATAEDNCGAIVEFWYEEDMMSGGCVGSLVRTYYAQDECGNVGEFMQIIHLIDDVAPEFTVFPMDVTVECDNVPDVQTDEIEFSDNCTEVTLVYDGEERIDGDCIYNYTLIRTWTITDNCDNSTTESQTITVQDTTDPVWVEDTLPMDETVECSDVLPEIVYPEATDNCSDFVDVQFTEEIFPGDCPQEMEIQWIFRAYDECGNMAVYVQHIYVVDTTAPQMAEVEDMTFECDEAITEELPDALDNCGEVNVWFEDGEMIEGDCPQEYSFMRTYFAEDECDNVSEASITIYVVDTTDPEFVNLPLEIEMPCDDITAPAGIEVFDNCGVPTWTWSDENTDAGCAGTILRTFTVTDACGNSSTLIQTITLIDNVAPEFTAFPADATVECDAVPEAQTSAIDYSDNCTEVTLNYDGEERIDGNCEYNYTLVRTWTITDNCDNSASQSQTITVQDTTAPELFGVPEDMELSCNDDIPDAIVSAEDNCSDNLVVSVTADTEALDCGWVFTRTWCTMDDCGNETCATQIITIYDDEAPAFTYVPADITLECDEDIPYEDAVAEDNCSEFEITHEDTMIEGDCPQSYTIQRCYTAVDACDNSVTSCQMITVEDTTAPVADEYEIAIDLPCDDYEGVYITATDNCGDVTITYEDSPMSGGCEGSYVRSYTLTDECGNESFEMQIIHLYDNTLPEVVSVPADITIECDEALPTDEAVFTDNCDEDLTVTLETETTDMDCGSIVVQTWTAVDNCENFITATRTITVEDTTDPIISGEDAEVVVECDMTFDLPVFTVTDNCDENISLNMEMETIGGGCTNEWTEIYTWTATDNCDNSAQRTLTLHYEDTTAPMFTFVPSDDEVSCDAAVPSVQAEATDNCGEVTITFEDVIIDGECAYAYTIERTWTATDECENFSEALTMYYVYDSTPPVLQGDFSDVNVECPEDVPSFDEWTVSDNCDSDPVVETNWDFISEDDCGNYEAIVTCSATDACGNTASTSFMVVVADQTNPVLIDTPDDLVLDCDDDVPAAEDCIATDNCDDDVTVTFTEEIIGDLPDPEATSDCNTISPEVMYGDVDWGMWLEGMNDEYVYYEILDGEFQEYPNGTAHFSATLVNVTNPDGGFYANAWFYDGMTWDDWSTQLFPTSYKDDLGLCPDAYLDWTYYIMDNTQSNLIGWGDYTGSFITLEHAPANMYYGFQVGTCANNVNTNFGAGGWFTYEGLFVDSSVDGSAEVMGAGDFAWDSDCCPDYMIERTWCATDCTGNFVCETQVISFEDLDGIVGPTPPSLIINDIEVKDDFGFTAIAPNPAFYRTTIEFKANTMNRVKMELYDSMGNKVMELYEAMVSADEFYRVDLNTRDLKAGIYTVRLSSVTHSETKQVVVVR